MKRITGGWSRKAGSPPGSLVHIGARKREDVLIRAVEYNAEELHETSRSNSLGHLACPGDRISWINISGLHDVDLFRQIGTKFGLHNLVLEDILDTEQRPKIEEYGDYLYIVAKMVYYQGKQHDLVIEQVSMIVTDRYVITIQENGRDVFNHILERLKDKTARIRHATTGYLAYSLIDAIVDNYFRILEDIGLDIEAAEDQVMVEASDRTLQSINYLKRTMLFIRQSVWPMREVLNVINRGDFKRIDESTLVFFRDAYDHIIQIMDTVEIYRDLLSGILDIYLTRTSNRMNEIMKVLTVISTIFMPLTFIAGVYGMNFKHMPETEWRYGYLFAWLLMAGAGAVMILYFRKKKWF